MVGFWFIGLRLTKSAKKILTKIFTSYSLCSMRGSSVAENPDENFYMKTKRNLTSYLFYMELPWWEVGVGVYDLDLDQYRYNFYISVILMKRYTV